MTTTKLLCASALLAGFALESRAALISVNLREFANDVNDIDADESYGVAAEGSVTNGWMNAFGPGIATLNLADGTPTTVSATGNNPGGTDTTFNTTLNDTPMRAGMATFSLTPASFPTITLAGLAGTFTSYDLIVYFTSNDGADQGQISDGTTTYFFSLPGGTGSQTAALIETTDTNFGDGVAEGSYAVFRGLTADSVTLEVRAKNIAAGNGGTFVGIGGYQINGTLLPEPGSLALMTLGGLMIARRRRSA